MFPESGFQYVELFSENMIEMEGGVHCIDNIVYSAQVVQVKSHRKKVRSTGLEGSDVSEPDWREKGKCCGTWPSTV